jgi:hypothetical protein
MPDRALPRCSHDGFYSGQARYRGDTAQLRYVVVCDDCQSEIRELGVVDYRPEFNAEGTSAGLNGKAGGR